MRPDRIAAVALFTLLTACAPGPSEDKRPTGAGVPLACDAAPVQAHIGVAYDAALGQRLQAESGARALRVFREGDFVTMDFRADRLNVKLDPDQRILAVTCG